MKLLDHWFFRALGYLLSISIIDMMESILSIKQLAYFDTSQQSNTNHKVDDLLIRSVL